jgi:peptidoglycan LD-endopeptidase LytH
LARLRLLVAGSLVVGALVGGAPAAAQTDEMAAVRDWAEDAAQGLADAETRLAELESEIQALEHRSQQAQAILGELQASVRSTVVRRYVAGEAPDVVLLSGGDLTERVEAAALVRFLIVGDQAAIDRHRAATEDLEVAASALDTARADQHDAIDQLRNRQAELEAQLARLQELERQRQAEEQRRQREEDERRRAAEAQAQAAQAQAAQAAQAQASAPPSAPAPAPPSAPASAPPATAPAPPATPAPTTAAPRAPPTSTPRGGGGGGGGIALQTCPVAGPVTFVDTWGAARSGGRRHKGVDMMSPRGTPVVAPVPGRVEHRGNSLGGLSYHLSGDDGHYYYGTHLSAYGQGGRVGVGTVIGYVGATGNATTPHLHFEVHPHGGGAANPYPYVRAVC